MKKIIACFLSVVLLLFSCPITTHAEGAEFNRLSDPRLLEYIDESLYDTLVSELGSDEYFIEDVESIYLSDEYLRTVEYNSRENVYFGYKLSDLNAQFGDQKYVFTVNEQNQTIVVPIEEKDNDALNTIIKNVSIGTGVILVCVTVSVLTGGTASAAAVHMIFAVAAQSGTVAALSGAAFGGITSGVVTGYKTGNMEEALQAAAVGASEGYKWGAISGAVTGGGGEGIGLWRATLNGLTMNEAALIQMETKLPLEFIRNFNSMKEFRIYQEAGLTAEKIGDMLAYSRGVDLNSVITDQYGKTMTNAERILAGNSPVDPKGIPYELHHIGQEPNSPLAILTKAEHMQDGHNKILHFRVSSEVEHGAGWKEQVNEFWLNYLEIHGVAA